LASVPARVLVQMPITLELNTSFFINWYKGSSSFAHCPIDAAPFAGCDEASQHRRRLAAAVMIHLPASVRVYLCLTPCDMRKSFDSLQALVREHLELDAATRMMPMAPQRLRVR